QNFIEIEEPVCWACGEFWWGKYDLEYNDKSIDEYLEVWNNINPLERCHIIPKQFGGSNKVDNLFLMCRSCHDKAPNTKSREAFFIWVKAQCHVKNLFDDIKRELETFGLTDSEEIYELLKDGLPSEFKKHIGIHFNKRLGSKVTTSTVIATIERYI